MSDKIVVPDGMREAGIEAWKNGLNSYISRLNSDIPSRMVNHILEAALRWQSENPIVPTEKQRIEIINELGVLPKKDGLILRAIEIWQRRCFLATDEPQYREIQMTKGQVALVDPKDFERLNSVEWYARQSGTTYYAERHVQLENGLRGVSSMHREVIGAEPGEFVDHIDRNGLHNWSANLRLCSEDQNKQNVGLHSDKQTSKYKGVCRNEEKGKYVARIGHEGAMHHIGYFDTEEEAARAYDREARIHHGEFAYINFPDDARRYLAPEPEEPEAIKDLLWDSVPPSTEHDNAVSLHNTYVLAGYLRGQNSLRDKK